MIMTARERLDNERELMLKSIKTLRRVILQDLKDLEKIEDRLIASYQCEKDNDLRNVQKRDRRLPKSRS